MKFFSAEWWDSLTSEARAETARWWLALEEVMSPERAIACGSLWGVFLLYVHTIKRKPARSWSVS